MLSTSRRILLILSIAVLAMAGWQILLRADQDVAPKPPQGAAKFPPFAGTVVNFDRQGDKTVACLEELGGGTVEVNSRQVRRTRVWMAEREVMQRINSPVGSCDPSWAPGASQFVLVAPDGLWIWPATIVEGGRRLVATHLPEKPQNEFDQTAFSKPRWSPDGLRIAYVVSNGGTAWIEAVQVATGRAIFKSDSETYTFEWGTDGRSLKIGDRVIQVP